MYIYTYYAYVMYIYNNDGMKVRNIGLTCKCYLSNIISDNIFY